MAEKSVCASESLKVDIADLKAKAQKSVCASETLQVKIEDLAKAADQVK